MRRKDVDKEKHILITARKLFSTKNYHRISMQEVADVCGVSKGSLYVYFKSKEDLLLNILQHYFQSIEDEIAQVELDATLTTTEKFRKELEIKIKHYMNHHEFYRLQSRDLFELASNKISPYLHQQNIAQIKWTEQYLLRIYGDKIQPFVSDGAFLLMGMIRQYIELIYWKHFPLDVHKIVHKLFTQIDYILKGMLANNDEPLINENLWSLYLQENVEEKEHPLHLIKQLKQELNSLAISSEKRAEAIETLAIMEQELISMQPRSVILRGMLHNLGDITEIEATRLKLEENLQLEKRAK
ncbi:TetR/AcrR family transcriptional regulator [Gracilibacillus dipsosauri]|uniref:HTH tetR-type domain-containing protein n=1 Tax=Gracilibacillus dipsosauri TaxID=178340 RepID=A0A317L720_9BACI|nr:TetR/AcrR family transcriptional regulator [Gracilibacillus dipsosauri]PWU69559.1 hypothetical protein DLJ74_06205 [Gracilibacillus dipsosauri]